MPTISEFARARAVSHQYISKLVKRGLPLSTFEAADLWREAHASSKASTNPIRIARVMDDGDAREPLIDHEPRKCPSKNKISDAECTSPSTIEDALMNARKAADEAWRLLHESMIEGRPSKIQVLLNIHNKAVEARLNAECAYREELERQKILIPLSEAQSMARKVVCVIVSRLNALPHNVASRCNPTNPHIAMGVLEDECASILKDAQQAL
jgi:hypothetical protein